MKRTCLMLTVVAAAGVGGCAWNMSHAEAFGGSVPRPSKSSVTAAAISTSRAVSISGDVLQQWSFLYLAIDRKEFALCLEGEMNGREIRIDNFRLARIRASSAGAVDFERCDNPNYLGMAHNHPRVNGALEGPCYFSETDQQSFHKDKRAVVDVVICGSEKFLWVDKPAAVSDTIIAD